MRTIWAKFLIVMASPRGSSMVEYVILISLIAIAALIAVATFGLQVSQNYSEIVDTMP